MAKSDTTDERRERVESLWAKSDSVLTDILIAEGYFGKKPRTPEGRETQRDTARRTLRRDRQYFRELWADEKKAAKRRLTRGEYVATLRTNMEDLRTVVEEMDEDARVKDRVDALHEIRQCLEAIAKAEGVDRNVAADDGDDKPPAAVGVILNFNNLSAEEIEALASLGGVEVGSNGRDR